MIRYALALVISAAGPWVIWPGADLCERHWGREEAMFYLLASLMIVMGLIAVTCDGLPRKKYLVAVIQFILFFLSVALLKYISYLTN